MQVMQLNFFFKSLTLHYVQETGAWMAELLITSVIKEDFNKNFTLTASNELGNEVFNINILFDAKPPEYDSKIFTPSYFLI